MEDKKWIVVEKNKKNEVLEIAKAAGISTLTAQILVNRGVASLEAIEEFLQDQTRYYSPLLLTDCEKAAKRILKAIEINEKIVIYGDYDVDGICSTALMYRFLRNLGAKDISYYIPDRKTEGYGLNITALENICSLGAKLIVTVDCGISNYFEIEKIKEKIDVIITDHHQPPEKLPEAFAIINPAKLDCKYPFKKLAGVGVAYKLCQAIWQIEKNDFEVYYNDLLELVALATVADIVELQDENRVLVKQGLKALGTTNILGLKELIIVSKLAGKKIDAGKIGFILAPRLNAAGRLGNAQLAVKLLTTDKEHEAKEIAEFLNNENELRQNIEQEILDEALKMLAEKPPEKTIVLAGKNWNAGVIGIVASRLVEKYYLPTIIFSVDEQGIAKGSGRSIRALDLHKALASMKELFLNFGGHHQAAGLSLREKDLPAFSERFETYVQNTLLPVDFVPTVKIDALVSDFSELTKQVMDELEKLEPFGEGNPKPSFAIYGLKLLNKRSFQDGKSINLSFVKNSIFKNAVFWREARKFSWLQVNDSVNMVFNLSITDWIDPIQITIKDLKKQVSWIDLRTEKFDLNELVNESEQETTCIYSKKALTLTKFDNVITDLTKYDCFYKKLLILDLPLKEEWEDFQKKLSKCLELEIILGFSFVEIDKALLRLEEEYIDREKMKKFFILLRQELQLSDRILVSVLQNKNWFQEFDFDYLSILQEINLLECSGDCFSLKNSCEKEKKELNNSKIFQKRHIDNKLKQEFLQKLKATNISDLF